MFKWKNKRILITGSSGFVGQHLYSTLTKKGARVYGLSRSAKGKNDLSGSILDFSIINEFVKKNKIQICYHLAAEALVESGQKDPYHTFKSNIEGALNLLEITRQNNLEKLIVASSSHVYGNNKLPYLETYPAKPSRPYETSKTCIDLIAQSYANSFNLPVLIARFVNIYGPGDLNFNRLIPKTMKSVASSISPTMWGGEVRRNYLYIDDAINAYVKLGELPAEKMEKDRVFNIGGRTIFSVEDVINEIIKVSGKKIKIKRIEDARLEEIKSQYVSSAKARRILHWKANTSFATGLAKTYKWYEDALK